jgi:DNA polymerase I-like protein with 3'-5' exonuclease and polymerase domains
MGASDVISTKTGRLSTSKTIFGTGMNMQNLDYRFQTFLIPDPGFVFLDFDKARAEWIIVAFASDDANMRKVVEEGLDPHTHTAHLMFDLPKDLIAEEDEAVGHLTDPADIQQIRDQKGLTSHLQRGRFLIRNMSLRQAGKKSNHGLNYDEGPDKFALVNEIPLGEARRIIALYHEVYPNIRNIYHLGIQHQLGTNRIITNCFGERRRFLGPIDHELYRAAYAHIPQSTVAHLVNQGIIDNYYSKSESLEPLEQLIQVHDSIRCQYPIDKPAQMDVAVREVFKNLDPLMEYNGHEFRIETDLKVGFNGASMYPVDIEQQSLEDITSELQRAN